MKVLVFGAGVIGCYLTHVLCSAGHDVTLLARGRWKETLEKNGLVLHHHLQHRKTVDHPKVIGCIEEGMSFQAAFAVMPCHQMEKILIELGELDSDILVLVGNNLHPSRMQREILHHSKGKKEILFGFQVTAGQRFEEYAVVERLGPSGLDLGCLHSLPSLETQDLLTQMFRGTGYGLHWQRDMEAYLFCHPCAVLPIAYVAYICSGDLRRSTAEQRRQMLHAPREAYDALKQQGIEILPDKDDLFYRPGPRRLLMRLLYFIMAKSRIGDLVACAHCRNAVSEMEMLDLEFAQLLSGSKGAQMPVWNALRAQMPSWQELHETYDHRKGEEHEGL